MQVSLLLARLAEALVTGDAVRVVGTAHRVRRAIHRAGQDILATFFNVLHLEQASLPKDAEFALLTTLWPYLRTLAERSRTDCGASALVCALLITC
jgi:hypothetical protein